MSTAVLAIGAPVKLDHSEQWLLENARGQAYRIMLSLPDGEPPAAGYPVLYVLDANAYFPVFHAARETLASYRDSVIVGIGYPDAQPLNFLRRSYDFSPPVPPTLNDPPQGGQDDFLTFIERTLMPKVAARVAIDEQRQSLFGHSFGGMFAIYAMFSRPSLFAHVVAVSPSLWWRDHYLRPQEAAFAQAMLDGAHRPVDLTVIVAEHDIPRDIDEGRALTERLAPLSTRGMRSRFALVPGVDHMSVPFQIVPRVMQDVFGEDAAR